jgi:hypothetical protein
MEDIINKLNQIKEEYNDNHKYNNTKSIWKNWSLEEIKKLLEIYLVISKKEAQLFDLIYSYHGCDSWEDIFRDYNISYLEDKAAGVEIAINEIDEKLKIKK